MPLTLRPLTRTTPLTRTELQAEDSGLSLEAAHRYGVTAHMLRKWCERDSIADRPYRPTPTMLHRKQSTAQEAVATETRRLYGYRWMTCSQWCERSSTLRPRGRDWRDACAAVS